MSKQTETEIPIRLETVEQRTELLANFIRNEIKMHETWKTTLYKELRERDALYSTFVDMYNKIAKEHGWDEMQPIST